MIKSNNKLEDCINKHDCMKYHGTDPLPDAKKVFMKTQKLHMAD